MPTCSTLLVAVLLCLIPGIVPAQPADVFLGRLDQASQKFSGVKATIRRTTHTQGIDEDEVETGDFFVKRSGNQSQIRIDFKQPNVYSVVLSDRMAEVYRPKIKDITEYDLRAYKDVAEKLFLLGFGMPGRELAANYQIGNVRHDAVEGQACTHLELTPKSDAVRKQLKSIEVWISDQTLCPARQVFHMPNGSRNTADFSQLEVNPNLAKGTFDLPKDAKRKKVN
ncbi:MAG: outer membrane lipoprotein carrier protein LolA [Ignavibacteriota bacterium]